MIEVHGMRVFVDRLGNAVELPIGETTIGRDYGCVLRIDDPAVSRRHVRLLHRSDGVYVEDLRSTNGTQLNGRPLVAPAVLCDGDTITIGAHVLTVRFDEDADFEQESTAEHRRFDPRDEQPATVVLPIASAQPRPLARGTIDLAAPDRRRHDRRTLEVVLRYVSSELEIDAITRNLSDNGVFVCTEVLDPVGTPCELTFYVDGRERRLRGVVRRVVEHVLHGSAGSAGSAGLGVEFVEVTRGEAAWLRTLLAIASEQARDAR
jgi:pSer/pThr/pTyr-binding forkhead associated (FHA) protein